MDFLLYVRAKFEVSPIMYHDGVFLMYCIIMYVGLSNNASFLFSFSFSFSMKWSRLGGGWGSFNTLVE